MTQQRTKVLAVSLTLMLGASAWLMAQSGTSPLEGTWSVQAITDADPGAPVKEPKGQFHFQGRHYSRMIVRNSQRSGLGNASRASADDLRAVWGPAFAANAGTFTVNGNLLRFRPTVAKNPISGSPEEVASFTVNGDTLTITGEPDGPQHRRESIRLVRVR